MIDRTKPSYKITFYLNPNDNLGVHKRLDFDVSELPDNEKIVKMLEDFKGILK